MISVGVRRFHDINRSGWQYGGVILAVVAGELMKDYISHQLAWVGQALYFVAGIIMLIFACTRGTEGENRFGPDPLA
jgi:uncharacterized membrane protein YhaH (DUF805 family)